MKAIKKILVPTDFSSTSREAVKLACQLAQLNSARLILFHVIPLVNLYDINAISAYQNVEEEIYTDLKKVSQRKMHELQVKIGQDFSSIEVGIEIKDRFDESDGILDAAREHQVDLIVIGSHGRKGINRILMGSVAETVLRHASCDVLVYKHYVK